MPFTPQDALQRLTDRQDLSQNQVAELFRTIMGGEVSPVMTAAILTGLRVKVETVEEIAGAASVMREFSRKVDIPAAQKTHFLDIVGTGGDGTHSFNISTAAMFVAAGAGAKIAKHGNRSVSSKSGSADVLEALGVRIDLQPGQVADCVQQCGMGFMFAPTHHPAMKAVGAVRKEMGVRTIFNILGPLTNPAEAPNILMGVFAPELVGKQVRALQKLGAERALVVHGSDGMDEITLGGATQVGELRNGNISEYEIHPQDFGLPLSDQSALSVSNAAASCALIRAVLNNEPGPALNIVLLNAGAALFAANRASDIKQGIDQARASIQSGAAKSKLAELVKVSQDQ